MKAQRHNWTGYVLLLLFVVLLWVIIHWKR